MTPPTMNQFIPDTLCHICSLRCQTNEKLLTHMKNHKEQNSTYNMSSMQNAIKDPLLTGAATKTFNNPRTNIICRKCGKALADESELKNHIKTDHKSYRACKNFSAIASENKCTWKEKCGFSHLVLEPGNMQCWDCGDIFSNKKQLNDPQEEKIMMFQGAEKSNLMASVLKQMKNVGICTKCR